MVVLIVAAAAGVLLLNSGKSTSSTTGSGTSSTNTRTSGPPPSTLTYESAETIQYLDPAVSYYSYDYNIMQNVYEPILWYNHANATDVIPWLAQSFNCNTGGTQCQFTLRSGIKFADGEALNSSAVWFAINRALINDGSSPVGHGTQSGWLIQQLSNQSLSTFFNGAQTYGNSYVAEWLKANFIQSTGLLTFNVNIMNPNVAFPFLFANPIVDPIAPGYTMTHDLGLWTATSAGYKLPFPTLSGNFTAKSIQYFDDLSATCNANGSATPAGCGATYLNTAANGSLAGTGPYSITSDDTATNTIPLAANPSYWGGPYQFMTPAQAKISPQIKTVIFKFVADQTTREIDIQNAAKSGGAMAIDVESTNLYDVASKADWLSNGTLVSTLNGVSLYGPYQFLGVTFDPYSTNVTSALTGAYYSFQPFADVRFRQAFNDAVNMTTEWISNADKLGQVAPNVVPPGLPPTGSFNSSIKPDYSFNPDMSAQLLLQAMQHPITSFKFANGTAAPSGLFSNVFGCTTLNAKGQCDNPVPQTIPLTYATGDTSDEAILNDMAATINNASIAYNMGLTVTVVPLPAGQELTEAFSVPNHLYMYSFGWIDDYPWVLDFTGNMLAYPGTYPGGDSMNYPALTNLYHQSLNASAAGNLKALVGYSDQMSVLGNQLQLYLWTFDNVNFVTMTSNVQGLTWNSNLGSAAANGVGPEYFATLY
ncbi:MAG TPA: ABC transporter substrate-binding protein [Nitrososphaerales archaeon]|nr:ABC transporter substrate-binding protein [Nitrososphaerales archaeon]